MYDTTSFLSTWYRRDEEHKSSKAEKPVGSFEALAMSWKDSEMCLRALLWTLEGFLFESELEHPARTLSALIPLLASSPQLEPLEPGCQSSVIGGSGKTSRWRPSKKWTASATTALWKEHQPSRATARSRAPRSHLLLPCLPPLLRYSGLLLHLWSDPLRKLWTNDWSTSASALGSHEQGSFSGIVDRAQLEFVFFFYPLDCSDDQLHPRQVGSIDLIVGHECLKDLWPCLVFHGRSVGGLELASSPPSLMVAHSRSTVVQHLCHNKLGGSRTRHGPICKLCRTWLLHCTTKFLEPQSILIPWNLQGSGIVEILSACSTSSLLVESLSQSSMTSGIGNCLTKANATSPPYLLDWELLPRCWDLQAQLHPLLHRLEHWHQAEAALDEHDGVLLGWEHLQLLRLAVDENHRSVEHPPQKEWGLLPAKIAKRSNRDFLLRLLRSKCLHLVWLWSKRRDEHGLVSISHAIPCHRRKPPGFYCPDSGLHPIALPRGRRPSTGFPVTRSFPNESELTLPHQATTEKIKTRPVSSKAEKLPSSIWPVEQDATLPQVTVQAGHSVEATGEICPRRMKPMASAARWVATSEVSGMFAWDFKHIHVNGYAHVRSWIPFTEHPCYPALPVA